MAEFELKFQVPPDQADQVEAALRRGKADSQRLRARYFDTPDEALADKALVLRLRQEGGQWVQTAKGPGRSAFDRLEHNAPVADGETAQPDPARHDGHAVGAALRAALKGVRGELQATFETDVTRLARTMKTAGSAVEVAFDRGEIRSGGNTLLVLEVEFELKEGNPSALFELAATWCEKHGLWLDPLSKSGAGRRLAHGDAGGPPQEASAVPPADTAQGLAAAILDAAMQQALWNARELAAGTGGDEHIHELRVGLRRLRTALRELGQHTRMEPLDPAVEGTLEELFSTLGAHRDGATLLPQLQRELAAQGSPALPWQPELPDVGAAVRGPAVQAAWLQLLARIEALREAAGGTAAAGTKGLRKVVRKRLAKLHDRCAEDGSRFVALAQAQRHRVRKRLKRLRYLAELTRPLFRGREVDRYVGSLKKLQDALGRYQDACAGRALFEARAADDAGAWFAVGWLTLREEELARDCARACRRMEKKARPFWD